jgi:hypothetical protein
MLFLLTARPVHGIVLEETSTFGASTLQRNPNPASRKKLEEKEGGKIRECISILNLCTIKIVR